MSVEQVMRKFLNLVNAVSVAISAILIMLVRAIEENRLEQAGIYVHYLLPIFAIYLILKLIEEIPSIARWFRTIRITTPQTPETQ